MLPSSNTLSEKSAFEIPPNIERAARRLKVFTEGVPLGGENMVSLCFNLPAETAR